jgi:hypothetical protein
MPLQATGHLLLVLAAAAVEGQPTVRHDAAGLLLLQCLWQLQLHWLQLQLL